MMRSVMASIISAVIVGIGASWVATQAQMKSMTVTVEALQKEQAIARKRDERMLTVITQLEERLGVTRRDIERARQDFQSMVTKTNGVHEQTLISLHSIDLRLSLLEAKMGLGNDVGR